MFVSNKCYQSNFLTVSEGHPNLEVSPDISLKWAISFQRQKPQIKNAF